MYADLPPEAQEHRRRINRDAKRRKRGFQGKAAGRYAPLVLPSSAERTTVGTSWRRFAACSGTDPVVMDGETAANERQAVAICAGCPVRAECGLVADLTGVRYGIWAGVNRGGSRLEAAS